MPDIALLGIPYDGGSSFAAGAAHAPRAIRDALASDASNSWAERGVDTATLIDDRGDVIFHERERPHDTIERAIQRIVEDDCLPFVLGGDHSITWPIIRALHAKRPKLTIVQFDAHPDLYDSYNGNRLSHACQFARIMEERLATKLVQVGIRTMNDEQRMQAKKFGVEVIDMHAWMDGVRSEPKGPVYVSLDVDAIDPGFAPGVSHREPGGLTPREVIDAIQRIPGPIIGADLVEYNPLRDVSGVTATLCAKLVKELAACMTA